MMKALHPCLLDRRGHRPLAHRGAQSRGRYVAVRAIASAAACAFPAAGRDSAKTYGSTPSRSSAHNSRRMNVSDSDGNDATTNATATATTHEVVLICQSPIMAWGSQTPRGGRFRGAHASRVLVASSRRDELSLCVIR
jgi:hypothetical protein